MNPHSTRSSVRRAIAAISALAMLAPLLVLGAAPAGAAPVTDVVVARGKIDVGNFNLGPGQARTLLQDTANFGPTGTVTVNSVTIKSETDTITAAYLSDVHIYFDGWIWDSGDPNSPRWATAELDALENWVNAGGILIVNEDLGNADELLSRFGGSIVGTGDKGVSDPGDYTPSNPTHPIVDGDFGAWTAIDPLGLFGDFGATPPAGWTEIAEDGDGDVVVMTRAVGDGQVIATGDEGLFRSEEAAAQNDIFTLNVFGWAMSLTEDSDVFPLAINLPGDQSTVVNTADSLSFTTVNGDGSDITWSDGGTLPTGLSISPTTGDITGTPTVLGVSTVTVTATPTTGTADSVTFDWEVTSAAGPLVVTDPGDQTDVEDTAITPLTINTTGGDGSDITFSDGGTLPAGLSIDPDSGEITGTPTTPGPNTVTITATPLTGSADSETFSWEITAVGSPLVVTDPGDQDDVVDSPIATLTMAATGGDGSDITWSDGGTLPAGLSIDPDSGAITGTPTAVGTTTVTITATPVTGSSDDVTFSWTITSDNMVPIAVDDEATGAVGDAFGLDICTNDTGGEGGNALTATGSPPPGIERNDCVLSGTPTTPGDYSFTYTLTDMDGDVSDAATVSITIAPKCAGEVATIWGTPGDDVLEGTSGRDVIHGLGGDDTITGLDGDDLICAGGGADTVRGGGGNDTVLGGRGSDTIIGNAGADDLSGQGGRDTIRGGRGRDTISGGGKADRLIGGNGPDTIAGGRGADVLIGGRKADTLRGNGGNDTLRGGKGSDTLAGGKGVDTCAGGDGLDSLRSCEILG